MKQDQHEPGEMPEKERKTSLVRSHMLISGSLPRREGRSELFSQGVKPLTVVDNSIFSPIRLTDPSDLPYDQEAFFVSHF